MNQPIGVFFLLIGNTSKTRRAHALANRLALCRPYVLRVLAHSSARMHDSLRNVPNTRGRHSGDQPNAATSQTRSSPMLSQCKNAPSWICCSSLPNTMWRNLMQCLNAHAQTICSLWHLTVGYLDTTVEFVLSNACDKKTACAKGL